MKRMGSDDRNEGGGPGECIEHAWTIVGIVLAGDGAYVEQECQRCPAVSVITPDELTGRTG